MSHSRGIRGSLPKAHLTLLGGLCPHKAGPGVPLPEALQTDQTAGECGGGGSGACSTSVEASRTLSPHGLQRPSPFGWHLDPPLTFCGTKGLSPA